MEQTYICVGEHASQPSVLAPRSLAIGHYIEQRREGQGSAELCLAPFAERSVSSVEHADCEVILTLSMAHGYSRLPNCPVVLLPMVNWAGMVHRLDKFTRAVVKYITCM